MKESREIIQKPVTEKVELERPFETQIPSANGGYGAYREIYAQEGMQLMDYWRAIRKRLWLVIGVTILITTLTAIYMARRPSIFQANAVVQVDLEQANQDLVTSDRRTSIGNSDPAYFNTQLQLLNSETLLRRVVKELNLDTNKDFQAARTEESVSAWRSLLKAVGLASDDKKKNDKSVSDVSVTASPSVASSEEIAEAIRLAPYVDIIRKNLAVEPVRESRTVYKDTRLIEVSFRHTNPDLAALVVNGIADVFTKQNAEKRSGKNVKTSDFLSDRVSNLQSQIKADEIKLADLKRDSNILDLDEKQTLVLQTLEGLNKQLLDAENARKNAEAQYNAVKSSPDKVKSLVESDLIRYTSEQEMAMQNLRNKVLEQITQLKAERDKLALEYREGADELVEIDTKINTLNKGLDAAQEKNKKDLEEFRNRAAQTQLDNLRTKYLQAKGQEDKIRSSYDQKYNEAQAQNQAGIVIRLLEQNIATNKGFLENLNKQVIENDVIAKGTDNNISIVEIAIPPDTPIAPRRLTTVLAALILSTLFGAGLALVLEYLDDSIKSTEEVENYLRLPALAAIPTIDSMPKRRLLLVGNNGGEETEPKANTELLINNDPRSSLAEAYRQLRTSILLSTAGHAPKSLLITSSLPSEGKTTTAVNTAISLAQTGAKVLVIDADMRRPRLHTVFGISNAEGLSSVLSSEMRDTQILDIIQYDDDAKLHLMPSGPIPPNPAELIGSEQMVNMLKVLQQHFTHVVVDSPPIASFTDGVLVASMVDGVILVVHSGKSSRQVVRRSRQLLADVGAKIFGVVLNNVNLNSQDNYYYYQSYYHRDYYRHEEE
ncbi:MAG: polysaccharide biosynthesis tyrosine autokinase [Acidobacteria bacterium]|nr:polysaccharide biosynthesis tyrosine autokinase [Acidobacteriota bacterium]